MQDGGEGGMHDGCRQVCINLCVSTSAHMPRTGGVGPASQEAPGALHA